MKKLFYEVYICNDLFSRFEQQILFLEKQAEATNPMTDHHGHDGPVQGLVSKHIENLKLGTENRLSELRNGMAGRTITGVTDRHRLFREIESLKSVTKQQDGPSQARRAVTGCVIPDWVGFLLSNLRGGFNYSGFNYKVSGLMLISLITWGLKEVTLSKLVGIIAIFYT